MEELEEGGEEDDDEEELVINTWVAIFNQFCAGDSKATEYNHSNDNLFK